MAADRISFNMWMQQINRIVWEIGGLPVYNLSDGTLREWFDNGVEPSVAAEKALKLA